MTDKSKQTLSIAAGLTGGLGIGLGFITGIDPSTIVKFLSDTAGNQIAQAGFFFTMAAWIHSGRVKKEIAKNFSAMTDAINNVATAFSQKLDLHGKMLEELSERVENLEQKKS